MGLGFRFLEIVPVVEVLVGGIVASAMSMGNCGTSVVTLSLEDLEDLDMLL